MKLEVGQFIRTNDGYINKIEKVNRFNVLVDGRDLFGEKLNIPNNEITKASYNIIDILEKGDYVNGCLVEKKFPKVEYAEQSIKLKGSSDYIYDIHVKSILTHEQMEQMAYKVGE